MSCLDPSRKWRHLKIVSRWSEGVGAFDHMRGLTRCASKAIRTLVFIAPKAGIEKLGRTFPHDVQTIAKGLNLELILEGI